MALTTKLLMRQGQALVMTPQLLQAIKLLQFSNLELAAFVQEELERNPLLERAEEMPEPREIEDGAAREDSDWGEASAATDFNEPGEADWSSESFATDRGALEASLGTELSNAFEDDRAQTPGEHPDGPESSGLSATSWTGSPGLPGEGEAPGLEAYAAAEIGLRDHLLAQLTLTTADPAERMIGQALIDGIDEAGYFTESIDEIADKLAASPERVETVLALIQSFDPDGIGARNLAECLTIQLRERDRFDPAMQALVGNLELVARRDFAALRKICGVDDEDIADMLAEIRKLDPKPGRAFGGALVQPIVPDVIVRALPDGNWHVELNSEVLPRVLVNQTYAMRVARIKGSDSDKSFLSDCLQTAHWLTKSLEQRARTILKVASEIVRHQDAFFAQGVEYLRPLNLKIIADAIGMHESTVSRVTSNKYMTTPRGLFELKYFFTASIASHNGGDAYSAEAVRFRIKQMIEREDPAAILSDDAIVARLKSLDVDIARRTVAKYRESLRIPSSVERRRMKAAP
ncbi:MAG: RNA polymerase sigma-54 factor [Beijerinckiaceae bacterium]|nr:MAG: RNA polymerase sigma-54 factor [Beijerinckiaceae bacterium]